MPRFTIQILVAAAILAAFVFFAPTQEAQASDVWSLALTSADAGSTQTGSLSAKLRYSIQCAIPACYKTGTSTTLSADCTKDAVLPGANRTDPPGFGPYAFDSSSHTKIVARALDAGNPNCQVFQQTVNPDSLR